MIPNDLVRAAVYARVSSKQQAQHQTIDSQVAALRQRIVGEGLALEDDLVFLDNGFSGSTLQRPALERLRDKAYAGAFNRLYVHSPDRLARKHAYQVVLLDEFKRAGVEVVFLNQRLSETPEDNLLLEVQGIIAEYERAKIIERGRRGRRHAAQRGSLNAIGHAPYGYLYIDKHQAGGEAYYQILPEQAEIIRQMFEWVGRDRLSLGEVCRRLFDDGVSSPKGRPRWNRGSVCDMLKNPAYKGTASYGKTRVGERLPRLRPLRNQPATPRHSQTCHQETPPADRINIPVPPIVSEELFAAVQEQLQENRRRSREQRETRTKHLLQGLVLCGRCGSAYCGRSHARKDGRYTYYRCLSTDAYRFGGTPLCRAKGVSAARLESAVWNDVREVLRDPDAVRQEYERRLHQSESQETNTQEHVSRQMQTVRRTISRLIDAFAEGLLSKEDFEPRIQTAKARLTSLEAQAKEVAERHSQQLELTHAIGQLNDFSEQLRNGLDHADWLLQRAIIRALVKEVKIEDDQIRITYRFSPRPFDDGPQGGRFLQHCRHSAATPAGVRRLWAKPAPGRSHFPNSAT